MCSHAMHPQSPSQWQTDADLPIRRQMVKAIIGILVSGKKQHSMDSIKAVVPFAKQVELELYKRAQDLTAYNLASTLEKRVWEVAQAVRNLCATARWQSEKDSTARRRILKQITYFLKKELEAEDLSEEAGLIMKMARHVEASMYQRAPSFTSYTDESTIERRIRSMQVARLQLKR